MASNFLREPFVQFLLLGGLIFGAYSLTDDGAYDEERIVVSAERIDALAAEFTRVWRRPPTEDERRALIDDFVREEVLYREALALGLDRDDAVVRQRLRQKMEFMADTGVRLLEPEEAELTEFLEANAEHYRQPGRLRLEQVFLGEAPGEAVVGATLERLNAGGSPAGMGVTSILPAVIGPSGPLQIDGVFGKGFHAQLEEQPQDRWVGPVTSGYGLHLVRISEVTPPQLPPLSAIRETVLYDWQTDRAEKIRERQLERLLANYRVEIADERPR